MLQGKLLDKSLIGKVKEGEELFVAMFYKLTGALVYSYGGFAVRMHRNDMRFIVMSEEDGVHTVR